jgi:hypothetical protein
MRVEQAMKNPNVVFGSPELVKAEREMSTAQKQAVLRQWKDQLEKLLVADEESMLRAGAQSGANADCLRRVTDVLTSLES